MDGFCRPAEGLGCYRPNVPRVAGRADRDCHIPACVVPAAVNLAIAARYPPFRFRNLRHSIRIVEIPLRLAQQEHMLMRRRGPVAHAFRHRVRLVPDDVAAQEPAIGAEGKG